MLPRVAIVGRPNVGKSSLLNRMVGRRVSIVEPTAGVTRDRVAVVMEHGGRRFELVDTGGLGLVDEVQLKEHVEAQIAVAIASADAVLFVVDGKAGFVPGDELVAQRLRRLQDRLVLVVNKVESHWDELSVHEWSRLGFGMPTPISAQEGFGINDLLDRVAALLPERRAAEEVRDDDALRFAIVGKRNSGKSTLTNLLVGEQRVIVSDMPGTTRDAVDVEFERGGRSYVAIDTAGVRKKSSVQDAIEFFSHARSTESIRRADVVVLLFDVTEEISQVDKTLATYIVQQHKPVLIVGNKVDLIDEVAIERWDAYIKQQLRGLQFAPVSFISAKDGVNVDATLEILHDLRRQARLELPTGELNRVLQKAQERQRPKARKTPRLYYGTQIGTEPLHVLVFVNEPPLFRGLYDRYLQNSLRDHFGCAEVPIQITFRKRVRSAGEGQGD
ncbi:MAG: ribosome biogenesis GTPase Der [Planctomycetota bacterium]